MMCGSVSFLGGCVGTLEELFPGDSGAGEQVDLASTDTATAPVELGPSGYKFYADIQADIVTKACAVCHAAGGSPPTFRAAPTDGAEKDTNYTNFSTLALDLGGTTDPDQSVMLKLMLPGGGHAGSTQLPSTTDPMYIRWRAWIADGGPR